MMRVAVEDNDAAGLALALEASRDAGEVDDDAFDIGARYARELERGDRGCSVSTVVLTYDCELELHRLELLRTDDVRHVRKPGLEEISHLGARAERRVMIEVDIQQHRDVGAKRSDGSVRLVAFDDEQAGTGASVAPELGDLA